MKPRLKWASLLLVATCAVVGVSGYLAVVREADFFKQEIANGHRDIAAWIRLGTPIAELKVTAKLQLNDCTIRMVTLASRADDKPLASPEVIGQLNEEGIASIVVQQNDGSDLLVSYFLVATDPQQVIELAEPLDRRDQYIRDTIFRTFVLMVVLVAVGLLLVLILDAAMTSRHRLEALIHKTERAADGDLLTPVDVGGHDGLTALARALNQMCEKLDVSQKAVHRESAQRFAAMEQLRHADRLKTVGRLASGVAHELGTPLNVVSGRAGLIASGKLSPEETTESAQTIRSVASRMTDIVQQLLNFARRSSPRRTDCDVRMLVDDTVKLLTPLARKRNATISVTDGSTGDVRCHADCGQLQQVISNLMMNAVLSRERDTQVTVTLITVNAPNPDSATDTRQPCIRLTVSDNGGGIDPDHLPHLFEPFFTTRGIGEGTGLGLSIAHGIVAEHGGWIEVESSVGAGSSFHVFLPARTPANAELATADEVAE